MKLAWTSQAWNDYQYWRGADAKVFASVNALIEDAKKNPFKRLGKPEPLKYELKGWWSRRITGEHRLVYRVFGKGADRTLQIAQCRYHYR